MSVRREAPKPRGNVPSTAALTMSGARNASDNVMRADRSFSCSRAAIASMPAASPETISLSHRRARAIAEISFILGCHRIGRRSWDPCKEGAITSRLRRNVCGVQGIEMRSGGTTSVARSATSIDSLLLRATPSAPHQREPRINAVNGAEDLSQRLFFSSTRRRRHSGFLSEGMPVISGERKQESNCLFGRFTTTGLSSHVFKGSDLSDQSCAARQSRHAPRVLAPIPLAARARPFAAFD